MQIKLISERDSNYSSKFAEKEDVLKICFSLLKQRRVGIQKPESGNLDSVFSVQYSMVINQRFLADAIQIPDTGVWFMAYLHIFGSDFRSGFINLAFAYWKL